MMNERLKELRKQVKLDINLNKVDPVFYEKHVAPLTNALSQGGNEVLDEFLEKFAELLLEEMYDFIMDESAKDNGIPDLGTVKQHFGVEE